MRNDQYKAFDYSLRENKELQNFGTGSSNASNNAIKNVIKNIDESQAVSLSLNSDNCNKQILENTRYLISQMNLANQLSKEKVTIKELAKQMKGSSHNMLSLNNTNCTSIPETRFKAASSEQSKGGITLSLMTHNDTEYVRKNGEHSTDTSVKSPNKIFAKEEKITEGLRKLWTKVKANTSLKNENVIVYEVSENSNEEDVISKCSSDVENEYVKIKDEQGFPTYLREQHVYNNKVKNSTEKDRYWNADVNENINQNQSNMSLEESFRIHELTQDEDALVAKTQFNERNPDLLLFSK